MKMKMTVLALLMAVAPQTRATIHRAFRASDYEIVWAGNPAEAAEASARCQPGLVLLDLNQTLLGGLGVVEQMRFLNPDAPLVVLSEPGFVPPPGVTDNSTAVLHKPVEPEALVDAANVLLLTATKAEPEPDVGLSESQRFVELLTARHDMPCALGPSYRNWGINE